MGGGGFNKPTLAPQPTTTREYFFAGPLSQKAVYIWLFPPVLTVFLDPLSTVRLSRATGAAILVANQILWCAIGGGQEPLFLGTHACLHVIRGQMEM